MVLNLPTLLAVSGLGLDVIGAAVIALPDIPRIRLILPSARIRHGLREMESTGLSEGQVGFHEIKLFLEGIYGIEYPENVWAMRVGFDTMSRYGFEAIYLFVNPADEDEQLSLGKDIGAEVDYRVARGTIQNRIDTQQALIRGLGFLMLSTGFSLQIIGRLV